MRDKAMSMNRAFHLSGMLRAAFLAGAFGAAIGLVPAGAAAQAPAKTQPQQGAQAGPQAASKPWAGIGRPATPNEIKAWDIDVRADFKGLPPGSGSVDKGMEVWEAKCASCHGTFGESNEVFTPIVGGTTKEDIETGRVANLMRSDYPQRTTLMKLSQISTLWDYVNRAMPWNAPKSLTVEEVYAVVAYILNLGDIVPADFVLSDKNIAEVQKRLPNRNGKAFFEPLWSAASKPDVQGDACMKNCATQAGVRSILPEFARDAHGNLAAQNRVVGPVRGANTTEPPVGSLADAEAVRVAARATVVGAGASAPSVSVAPKLASAAGAVTGDEGGKAPAALAVEANCMACHGVDNRAVGPSFREVADKYRGTPGSAALLAGRVKNGGQGVWGQIPMPANATIPEDNIRRIVGWILDGAP
jgi:cytochrome c